MTELLLRFRIRLESDRVEPFYERHGPVFHRWLPNGEQDAIVITSAGSNFELKLWFERWGYRAIDGPHGGFIVFDGKRQEVDPTIMAKQAILNAGPLMGRLKCAALSSTELDAIQEDRIGDPEYESVGKRVVKLICPPVCRLINILRTNYGQYWVGELEEWDSRTKSLGSYCRHPLNLQWSLDDGTTWHDFIPTPLEGTLGITLTLKSSFPEYPTKPDWEELGEALKQGFDPSPAAYLLARTHELLNQGNLKFAFIEGVSAVELALSEFLKARANSMQCTVDFVGSFNQLPLDSQVTLVAAIEGTVPPADLGKAVKAVKTRHKIVHKGYSPSSSQQNEVLGLMNVAAALLSGPRFRFPTINPGNSLRDHWDS